MRTLVRHAPRRTDSASIGAPSSKSAGGTGRPRSVPAWRSTSSSPTASPAPRWCRVASNFDQATLMFNMAKAMVEASPDLRRSSPCTATSSACRRTGSSTYKVIPADAAGQHGRDLHGVLIDELHVVPREVWDTLVTGVGARRQPLVMAITTAGYDRSSLAWEQHTVRAAACATA